MKIIEKEGFIINPNKEFVERLSQLIANNNGCCICDNHSIDPHCPCTDFKEHNTCHCKLYIKKEK